MGWRSGRLHFTLQREMGKRPAKPHGLSQKESDARYSKERDAENRAAKRADEYFVSKLENTIRMIKRALLEGLRFDYLLVDSWFTCKELVRFVMSRRIGCHLIGMVKMSKTKYDTEEGAMTANAIIARESKRKDHIKYSRHYKFYCCEVTATLDGIPVKLFFFRNDRKGAWNALLSTDTALCAVVSLSLV